MEKICDHTSVGMLVQKGDKILLIERAKFPKGFAMPAGHVDGDVTYEDAARRELKEEVGLNAQNLILIAEGRRENPCRRKEGSWHYWKIFKVDAIGDVDRNLDETKQANWYSIEEIKRMAQRGDELEPVMYDWLKELSLI